MTRLMLFTLTFLAVLGLWAAGDAVAQDCVALGGVDNPGECTLSDQVVRSGTFTLDKTLHITSTGKITVPAANGGNTLTLNICSGLATPCDLIMDVGAQISGNVTAPGAALGTGATLNINVSNDIVLNGDGVNGASITSNQTAGSCSGGRGGNINISADFDIFIEAGAKVTANARCPAGAITIISAQGTVDVDGLVESKSTLSGTGSGRPGGGPITIIARCDLSIDGTVRSEGGDPGANLIHLEGGCVVRITGLVVSTGFGHGIPDNPPTLCAGAAHPTKDPNSVACIEILAGDSLTITNTAELNADTGNGGTAGTSWIDLFVRGPMVVQGRVAGVFSVHANGNGGSNDVGGVVTAKSQQSTITASGRAFQASSLSLGGDGGSVTLEASATVGLAGATIEARGGGGSNTQGGEIDVRSFNGDITSDAGSLLDVTGGPPAGSVDLTACGAIGFPPGTVQPVAANKATGVCGGQPDIPFILPACLCGDLPGDGDCPEDQDKIITRIVDPTGAPHGVLPVHLTLQAAVNAVSSGETIGVFGTTTENVTIPTKRFTITQCTVARVFGANWALPVVTVSSPEKITIIGLDTFNGTVGWQIDTDLHDLKAVRATGATEACIWIKGDKNRVTWNALSQCAIGVKVDGATNDLRGGTIELGSGDGVRFTATATGNKLAGATIRQNSGNGVVVEGTANKVNSNQIDQNGLNGVKVTGSGNLIKGNTAGSSAGLGNLGDSFKVNGFGNTLDSNKASGSGGDGFDVKGGVAGFPNILKGNQSNVGPDQGNRENTQFEYRLLDVIKNGGGNKADGITVPKISAPAKCTQLPPGGSTQTLAVAATCE